MKILSMSGFVPEHICDVVRFDHYSGDRSISNFCGYASDYISQIINDESIDGAVYPKSCDSSRVISSYISDCGKFFYQLDIPSLQTSNAVDYFADVIKDYQIALENHFQIRIDDILYRLVMIANRNKLLSEIYDNLNSVSYSSYISLVHQILKNPLKDQIPMAENIKLNSSSGGKRAYIVGSFLSNTNIIKTVEKAGFNIVGDYLPESGRMISAQNATEGEDVYVEISKSILSAYASPTQNSFVDINKVIGKEIKEKKVECVFYITQKYCEPYDYFYVTYREMLAALNIPMLRLILNDSEDDRKISIEVEAFADVVG